MRKNIDLSELLGHWPHKKKGVFGEGSMGEREKGRSWGRFAGERPRYCLGLKRIFRDWSTSFFVGWFVDDDIEVVIVDMVVVIAVVVVALASWYRYSLEKGQKKDTPFPYIASCKGNVVRKNPSSHSQFYLP